MSSDTKVSIYYGPLPWFRKQLGKKKHQYLLDIVAERDELSRRVVHTAEGDVRIEGEEAKPRTKRVVAESADYVSLREHAIMNFTGILRDINPKHLALHNPPAHVHNQIKREYEVTVTRYEYPKVTEDTLTRFNDGFGDHLVGQAAVRKTLLAALYSLATERRTKPVTIMFYGPSGVGKTETAQFVNSLLGGELLRKQFSMFHSDKFATYVFGGAHSEDSFARDLLERESGVILIDEFDKANPVFHSAFYQLFDDGVFEDKNYSVRLGSSLIICTSNYATEDEIRSTLGDALYSRFDSLIRFEPLTKDEVLQVIDRLVDTRFEKLNPSEREVITRTKVKQLLYSTANRQGNVRKLGKLVDEVISLLLVQALLDSSPTRATDPQTQGLDEESSGSGGPVY